MLLLQVSAHYESSHLAQLLLQIHPPPLNIAKNFWKLRKSLNERQNRFKLLLQHSMEYTAFLEGVFFSAVSFEILL